MYQSKEQKPSKWLLEVVDIPFEARLHLYDLVDTSVHISNSGLAALRF